MNRIKQLMRNSRNRGIAIILAAALVVSGLAIGLTATLAADDDLDIVFAQPNSLGRLATGGGVPGELIVTTSGNIARSIVDNPILVTSGINGEGNVWIRSQPTSPPGVATLSWYTSTMIPSGRSFQLYSANGIASLTLANGGKLNISNTRTTRNARDIVTAKNLADGVVSNNTIIWSLPYDSDVLESVSTAGVVTPKANGVAVIFGSLNDCWGVARTIAVTVLVGPQATLITDDEGNHYIETDVLGIYVKVDDDGKVIANEFYRNVPEDPERMYPHPDNTWQNYPYEFTCGRNHCDDGDCPPCEFCADHSCEDTCENCKNHVCPPCTKQHCEDGDCDPPPCDCGGTNPNHTKPVITTETIPDGQAGEEYHKILKATGTRPVTWSLIGSLPAGLTLNSASGVISGTPVVQGGPFTVHVMATNCTGNDDMVYAITIAPPAIIPEPPTLPGGGSTETVNITLTAGYSTHSQAFAIGGIPAPSVSKTNGHASIGWSGGNITVAAGLTTAGSPYTASFSAANTEGTVTFTVNVTVTDAPTPPTLPGGGGTETVEIELTEGYSAHSQAFAIGGTPAPAVNRTSGNTSIGWSGGNITVGTGLTAVGGPYTASFSAANSEGTVTFTVNVTVKPEPTPPTLPNGGSNQVVEIELTQGYSAHSQPFAIGGIPAPSVSRTGGHTSINWIGGNITVASGLTAVGGPYTASFSAANSEGTVTFTVNVTVKPASTPPTLPNGGGNQVVDIELTQGYGAHSQAFAIGGIPAPTVSRTSGHVSIGWSNGNITVGTGLTTVGGPYTASFSATNSEGTVTFTVNVTVTDAPTPPTLPNGGSNQVVEIELTQGYGAFTQPFAIGGIPAPSVSRTSGHTSINWSGGNITVAAGLTAVGGPYTASFSATNTEGTVTFTVNVTVKPEPVPPTLPNGGSSQTVEITLIEGYSAPHNYAFAISGTPAPSVSKTNGHASIGWSGGNISVAGGLTAAGSPYTASFSAANSEGTANFTVNVTVGPVPSFGVSLDKSGTQPFQAVYMLK